MTGRRGASTVLVAVTPEAAGAVVPPLSDHPELSVEEYEVGETDDWRDSVTTTEPDCLVVSAHRPEGSWVGVVEAVRETAPDLPVVVVTTDGSEQLAGRAVEAGGDSYVSLEIESPATLVERVESAVRQSRQAARERADRYRLLVEHAGDPMCLLETDGTLLLCNQALSSLLGIDTEEAVGSHIETFVPEDDIARAEQLLADLPDEDRPYGVIESTIETASGETVPCEVSIAPIPGTSEGYPRSAVVVRDITERKQRTEQLAEKNQRLEEFVNVVSHDLRNPLNVAMARAEVLQEEYDSPHHEEIDTALSRMEAIIDDLLTMARSGVSTDDTQLVSIREIATDAWELVETGDATLTIDMDHRIEADPSRLQQLFENLFRNAMEHIETTPSIRIGPLKPIQTMTRASTDVTPNGFYIADNGPGIPPEDRDRVFDYGETSEDGGTGFGLAIVQDIVTEHDWQIHITSSATGGARFEIQGVSVADS